jgi:hypothetical protein
MLLPGLKMPNPLQAILRLVHPGGSLAGNDSSEAISTISESLEYFLIVATAIGNSGQRCLTGSRGAATLGYFESFRDRVRIPLSEAVDKPPLQVCRQIVHVPTLYVRRACPGTTITQPRDLNGAMEAVLKSPGLFIDNLQGPLRIRRSHNFKAKFFVPNFEWIC